MSKAIAASAAALVLSGLARDVSAADTLRCGRKLVQVGDSRYEVLAACGEPDDVQRWVELRSIHSREFVPCHGEQRGAQCSAVRGRTVEVQVEHWLYDFGRLRFMQHLAFEQGRLVTVRQGDRGHKK